MRDEDNYANAVLRIAAQMKYGTKDEPIENVNEDIQSRDASQSNSFNTFEVDENFDCSKFVNPTKDEIIKLLKRKYIANLKRLKTFVDVMKYKTSSKGVSICPISCESKFFNLLYGNPMNVSRVIQCAKDVGLLYCVNEHYQFHAYEKVFNFSKQYAYDKRVEKKLIELFDEYGINNQSDSINTKYVISIANTFKSKSKKDKDQYERYLDYMKRGRIRISQQTRLALDESYIVQGLNEMYPQYLEMLKTIDEDNKSMPSSSDYDYAIPTFSKDKDGNTTKVAIRKTNQYCTLKVQGYEDRQSWDGLDDESKGRIRDYVIAKRLGGVYENDVKSSIYRITYLLNNGVWLDRDVDLYPKMVGFDFENEDQRNLYKAPLAMKLYFSPSIEKAISTSSYQRDETKRLFKELNAPKVLQQAKDNMLNAIGHSYRSEIFLHESCIYTQVAHKIRSMGYQLIQIYDGFFTNKPLDEKVFDAIVKECALEYYEKYKGYWYKWVA